MSKTSQLPDEPEPVEKTVRIEIGEAHEVSVLRVRPGDVVVLRFTEYLSVEFREHIRAQWGKHASGTKCVVLDGGATLDVLRKELACES